MIEKALEASKPAVLSYRNQFIEFRAVGVSHWRFGKELPDGRIAYLEFDRAYCDVTGKQFAQGMVTRRKLQAAVDAARYWKREAEEARQSGWGRHAAASFASVGMALIGTYLRGRKP